MTQNTREAIKWAIALALGVLISTYVVKPWIDERNLEAQRDCEASHPHAKQRCKP